MDLVLNESRRIYVSNINKVQDYIESHLDGELNVRGLARVASFSEYHFQRIFRQITGESLYGFIKRLRLEKSVFLLRSQKRLSIQDVALSVGFSNQASFAKALKERYGVCGSEIRKMDNAKMDALIREMSMNGKTLPEGMYYNYPVALDIRMADPVKVLYVRHTGAYKGDSDLFMKLFARLYGYAHKKGMVRPDTKWFTVYHDYSDLTEEEKLRLSVCMSIASGQDVQGELGCMEIADGKYAVGRFLLGTDEYQGAWNYMVSKWLPESGYMPDDRLCFEYFPPQEYENRDERRLVEIFIPITPL